MFVGTTTVILIVRAEVLYEVFIIVNDLRQSTAPAAPGPEQR